MDLTTRTQAEEVPESCKKCIGPSLRGRSLSEFLQALPFSLDDPVLNLAHLVEAGYDRLPMPGSGATLQRWQHLAQVASHDLSLVKLYEGHTDALSIIEELGGVRPPSGSTWGTWAAEPPNARVRLSRSTGAGIRLNGNKAWCSGAHGLSHAVISAWDEQDQQVLACVELKQPGVVVTNEGWAAVGMAATNSTDVTFHNAVAMELGRPGDYTSRSGFWHGGAGIAACWYGGALALADTVRQACARRADPFRLAHLGAIDAAMSQAAALLRETAEWIDQHPQTDAMAHALCARAVAESAARAVLDHAGRALGATPYCRDRGFARMAADLPVFVRQSHAESDLVALAQSRLSCGEPTWVL